jgi:hypothetical protein
MTVETTYAVFRVDPGIEGESADDVANAENILAQTERGSPFLMREDWISIPLINATGSVSDNALESSGKRGVSTDHLKILPWTLNALAFIEAQGLCVEHLRLLALRPMGMFWPHRDVHPFFRLLLPIYAEGGDCLYLLGGDSYLAEVGAFYYLQPDIYHAALNLSDHMRFVLCFDITSNRKALDFVANYAERMEPRVGRLVLGERMRKSIEVMVTFLGESEPLLAGKLAMALGVCLLDGSLDAIQVLIYEGLSKCSQDRMTGDKVEELKKLFVLLEKHPSSPEVEHARAPGLFGPEEESS